MPSRPIPLLLTRPEAQSHRFAHEAAIRFGTAISIEISPLIAIVGRPFEADLTGITGLVFTSENAVVEFASKHPGRCLAAWCVGERTAEAARRAGFNARSASGGAAELAALLLRNGVTGKLLHLHGRHLATDLADLLTAAGLQTQSQVIYDQRPVDLTVPAKKLLAQDAPILLPLFSARTARLFAAQASGCRAGLRVAAISPAVASTLSLPVARLAIARQPNSAAMLAALASLIDEPPA